MGSLVSTSNWLDIRLVELTLKSLAHYEDDQHILVIGRLCKDFMQQNPVLVADRFKLQNKKLFTLRCINRYTTTTTTEND